MKITLSLMMAMIIVINYSVMAQPAPQPGYAWQLVEEDNFTSSSLNSTMWGWGSTPWGSENQSSCNLIPAEDTYLSGGNLVLRARSGSFVKSDGTVFPYSSGWAWTKTWRTYGYIEIRAQYPNQLGAWPAFWMLGDGWPPEFDIAEWRGSPKNYMTLAFYDGSWSTTTRSGDYTGWHTYGLEWAPGSLKWYIDGAVVKTYTGSSVPSQPMYVILSNGTDCSDGNGSGLPSYFNIDYLRWYQATPSSTSGVTAGQTYIITVRNSGRTLDAGGTANNSPVQVYSYWGGSNQQWTVQATSDGYYRIMNVASGRALDAGGTANNSPVQVYSYWGGTNQQWMFNNLGTGYFSITNRASGRVLDINGTANNSPAIIYSYWGGTNQQFQLSAISSSSARVATSTEVTEENMEETELTSDITIFPNPSRSGNFFVKFPSDASVLIRIYDTQGKEVHRQPAQGGEAEINKLLPSGIYMVKVTNSKFMVNRKLVID